MLPPYSVSVVFPSSQKKDALSNLSLPLFTILFSQWRPLFSGIQPIPKYLLAARPKSLHQKKDPPLLCSLPPHANISSNRKYTLLTNGQNISMPRVKLSLTPQFHYLILWPPTTRWHVALWDCDTWQNRLPDRWGPKWGSTMTFLQWLSLSREHLHNHLPNKAWLRPSKCLSPNPPCFLSLQISAQFTKWNFLLSSIFPHKKFLWILSNLVITFLGITESNIDEDESPRYISRKGISISCN